MIQLTKVKKIFNRDTAICLKDYTFEEGKSYCLLGPSGSGKSTLLNMIAGLVLPTEGQIIADNIIINQLAQEDLDPFRYENIGYIPQDLKLLEEFTVLDNLEIVGMVGPLTFSPSTVLSWVELSYKKNSKVRTLSGGEKQRVAIARALLKSPKVMLCDEPTGSLNYSKGVEIIKLLLRLHKENKNTLIVVTHDERMATYFDQAVKFIEDLTLVELPGGSVDV